METPNEPISFVPDGTGDVYVIGVIHMRVLEDGSRTDNRLGAVEFTLPPHTPGPVPHWHEMHDETFLVTKGTVRFHGLRGKTIDAKLGDYIAVGTRTPHTFSNPFSEEAKMFCTCTPSFYIRYFKMLAEIAAQGKPVDLETNRRAQAFFATIGVADDEMQGDKGQVY